MSPSNELKENWITIKMKLKKTLATLTDADLLLVECKHDGMISKLQARLGKTREELTKLIAEL